MVVENRLTCDEWCFAGDCFVSCLICWCFSLLSSLSLVHKRAKMAYAQVQPNETLFAADESKNTDVEALAFQGVWFPEQNHSFT